MNVRWEALVARCRGLASRLVSRDDLLDMARAAALPALAALLERAGMAIEPGEQDQPRALERTIRRDVGRHLARLARWLDLTAPPACAALFLDEEEVRSLRALVRGAAAGVPAEARLAGLVPTPMLPARVLEVLAAEPRPAGVVATLRVLAHPYAAALAAVIDPVAEPDLARLERALHVTFAERVAAAARLGDRSLARGASERIDSLNLESALALAREHPEGRWVDAHLPGGRAFGRGSFERVLCAADEAPRVASEILDDPELARVVREHGSDPSRFADRLLDLRLRRARRRARTDPLGVDGVLEFSLALRAQARNLSRVVWGLALSEPPERRAAALIGA